MRTAAAALSLFVASTVAAQEVVPLVVITEFMATNTRTLLDQDREYSDWIEIYNPQGFPVDLGGWHLTDDATDLLRWTIPQPTVLNPGSFLLVFASAKDRAISGSELHTNFRLSASGEYLALVEPNGVTIATQLTPTYPAQFADVWYGVEFRPGPTDDWVRFLQPTAGRANGIGGAIVTDTNYAPTRPRDADDIVVTARVATPAGQTVASMRLIWRAQFRSETQATMVDDGTGRDRAAGDGIWTGVVPSAGSAPGEMVRWRVVAATSSGGSARAPLFLDPAGSPRYFGAVIDDPTIASQLPVIHCFVQQESRMRSGTRCAVWFDGQFYDNVRVRERGGSSLGYPKPSWKFDFNSRHHFLFDASERAVEEINLNTNYADKAFVRQTLSWETYRNAGVVASTAFPVRLEVNNRMHSVVTLIEQPDDDLLRRAGLDPHGALYKMYNQMTSATGGVEKKTRKWENNTDLARLVNGVRLSGPALKQFLMDHVDVPAVINYMAATILIHDNDHVAKNYYVYRDSDGDGEWRFLPWDKDLTFGRNYNLSGGVLNDTMWANVDPYSHPMFGDQRHQKVDRLWNRLIDAMLRNFNVKRMFFRRLRTLMDEQLQAPTTPQAQLRYEQRIGQLRALMGPDVALDRNRWGIPNWGSRRLGFGPACDQLVQSYLAPRRQHLYVRHGPPQGGQIPAAQDPNVILTFGAIEADAADPAQDWIQIINCNDTEVDISGWRLFGGAQFTFEPGTVLPKNVPVYVTASPRDFRARATSPRGNEGHLVVGPWDGSLRRSEELRLYNAAGLLVARTGGFAYDLTPDGAGGGAITVSDTAAQSELFVLFSVDTSHPVGCGPVVGLGRDALGTTSLPLGTHPFHVTTNANGDYAFTIPPGTLPSGFVLDTRAATLDRQNGRLTLSHVERVTF